MFVFSFFAFCFYYFLVSSHNLINGRTQQEYQQQQQQPRKPWQFIVPVPSTPSYVPTTRVSWDDTKIYATTGGMGNGIGFGAGVAGHSGVLNGSGGDAYYCTGSNHECCNGNDVVLIKVGLQRALNDAPRRCLHSSLN